MKSLGLSLLILLSFMSLGQAGVLCEKAQIYSLSLGESDNLCLKLDSELNTTETRLLIELEALHKEVAKLLHVPVTELFSNPLNINITESVFGPFFSSANSYRLSLGVYPGEDYKFNVGVYLHELGHVLAASQNPNLPAIFEDLDHSVLFSETFADLLALSVHGHIITPEAEKGTCLDRLRYITTFQTYNYPAEYFKNFSEARIGKCCESLMKKPQALNVENFCKLAAEYFTGEIRFSKPFDPYETKNLDDHQVGLPILSFLRSFSEKTNSSMNEIFERIFFSKKHSSASFSCELKKGDKILEVFGESLHTAEHMLNDFKSTLSEDRTTLFDELFKKHALEKGMTFAKLDSDRAVKEKLIKKIINQSNVFEQCAGKIDLLNKNNCYLSCKSE